MLVRQFSILLIVSLLAGSVPAYARKDKSEKKSEETTPETKWRTRIHGRVVRADGKTAAAQATVKFVPLLPDTPTTAVVTNAKGWFVAEGVPVGYVDLVVESEGAAFVGTQVINVAPLAKQEVDIVIALRAERTASWWSGREIKPLPGGGEADGIAELKPKVGGKEFWTSPKGLAILGGIGAVALLAIASGGGSDASPSQ